MMPPSDDELDNLGRDAAEHYEPSGTMPDWGAMKGMLDTELPEKKDPRRRLFFLLFTLFLLGGVGYLLFKNTRTDLNTAFTTLKDQPNQSSVTKKASPNPATSVASVPASSPAATTLAEAFGTNEAKPGTGNQPIIHQPANNQLSSNHLPSVSQNNGLSRRAKKIVGKRSGSYKVSVTPGSAAANTTTETENNEDKDNGTTDKEVVSVDNTETSTTSKTADTSATNKLLIDTAKKDIAITAQPTTDSIKPAPFKRKTASAGKQRVEIYFLYAPELTTIGWTNIDKPGSNYGLAITYNLTSKLGIQAGFVKSRKNYTAKGKDFKTNYTPAPPYWLKSVAGYCDMYELPINFIYQFSTGKKYAFYGTAGLSSYFMQKESYAYNYASNYGGYTWNGSYDTKQNYWLSSATIGVGVKRNIFKQWDIAVNPFFKFPLKGMGRGELKMQSAGINFLLTYKPAFLQ